MTREGAVEVNAATGKKKRISKRIRDADFAKTEAPPQPEQAAQPLPGGATSPPLTDTPPLPHAPVEVLIKLSEQELIIEVADQGVGIKPEIRERIFERGITTKTRGDHGIGLYLIESYVTQAGGAIEVADNIPRGAIFSLFIPATGTARQLEDTDYAR